MNKLYLTYIALILALILTSIPIKASNTPPTLASEGAILMDGDTGQILYQKNPHTAFAPASITKLMTALLTLENLAPNEEIILSRNAVLSIERGSSHIGLREGEIITVENALHGLLLNSANEVANGLAETISGSVEAFAVTMNDRAAQLGATDTTFLNPHGLYEEEQVTSAYDMALITKELLSHDYFLEVMSHPTWQIPPTNLVDEIRYLHQSHKLLNPYKDTSLFREDTIAGKSGYTVLSGYTLVTVSRRDERTLIAVSLRTDANHLYSDTNALLDYGFDAFHSETLTPNDFITELPMVDQQVVTGKAIVTLAQAITLQLPTSIDKKSLDLLPTLPSSVNNRATIGDSTGSLSLNYEGQVLATRPLIISDLQLETTITALAQSEDPTTTEAIATTEPTKNFSFLWVVLLLIILGLSLLLIYYYKANKVSYKTYKEQQDAQRGHTH